MNFKKFHDENAPIIYGTVITILALAMIFLG